MASTSRDNICEVCSDNGASPHFGARNVCRACSAFWRRAISENKTFICRQNGNCLIHKSQKCMCKKCRLDKCYQVGMLVAGVLGKRQPKEVFTNSQELVIVAPIPIYPTYYSSREPVFLKRLLQNYADLCSIRRGTEKALWPESTRHAEGLLAGLSPFSFENYTLFQKAHLPTVIDFLHNSFEELSELNEDQKRIMMKPFYVYMQWLESCWLTYRRLPEHLYTSYSILAETLYWEASDQGESWFSLEKVPAFMKECMSKYTEEFVSRSMEAEKQKTLFEMNRIKLKDMEMAALVGLLFWNPCVEDLDSSVQQLMHRVRRRIYEDLGNYHKQIGEPEPESRLGQVLNILSLLLVEAHRFRDHLHLFSTFDALHKEDYFFSLVQNVT